MPRDLRSRWQGKSIAAGSEEGAGDQLKSPAPSISFVLSAIDPALPIVSSYLSFILGSPSRIHVRRTSPPATAAFARAVASPIVIGVPLKIIPNTC